jgi:hypothetical protein
MRLWAKLALFLRLYENDTKAQSSFLYHLSGGSLRFFGCLKTDVCAWPARTGGGRPTTNTAIHAPERS